MNLECMDLNLYENRYLTPQDFLENVDRIVHNAEVRIYEDPERFHRAPRLQVGVRAHVGPRKAEAAREEGAEARAETTGRIGCGGIQWRR